jgi:hypothetical protein
MNPHSTATVREGRGHCRTQRHRRYGAGKIYLKLRQAGELVNHQRMHTLRWGPD